MQKILKTFGLATACSLTLATASLAQDALQWQGFYGGLQANSISPEIDGLFIPLGSGQSVGVFGGYNHAVGDHFVIGGELNYNSDTSIEITPAMDLTLEGLLTIRARAGYAIGNALFYGSLGYAQTDVSLTGAPITLEADGAIFGLGVEAMLTSNISARIEYIRSDMDLSGGPIPPGTNVNADSVTMGIAYHF